MGNLGWAINYLEKFVRVQEYGFCLDERFKEALSDVVVAAEKYNKIKEALGCEEKSDDQK